MADCHTAGLTVVSRLPGRFRGEARVTVLVPGGARAQGLWFAGRPGAALRPWADLHDADWATLPAIARALGPGGTLMVGYGADETERALRRRVPAAATPLGLALLGAGCRWLKDWYFAEGGREGHTKLQGELPLDAERRRWAEDALRAELEGFLADSDVSPIDRAHARKALAVVDRAGERVRELPVFPFADRRSEEEGEGDHRRA